MIRGAAALALCAALGAAEAAADGLSFFRIGNGDTVGAYYPVGGLVAMAVSNPPGSAPCAEGGPCGVPGLVASALASAGSVENLIAVSGKVLESSFAQANTARDAFTARGAFAGRAPMDDLRLIANLYPERVHIVVPAGSPAHSVADLAGARIAVGQPGSGTRGDAMRLLHLAGITEDNADLRGMGADAAAQALAAGEIDALIYVAGAPAPVIADLAARHPVRLIPVEGDLARAFATAEPLFTPLDFPAGIYPGSDAPVPSLSVPAQWITRAEFPDRLIYALTRVLWNDNTMRQLAPSDLGRQLQRGYALESLEIPLHPGAERYYREAGLLGQDAP
ncbi:MAG: TAXI family TRAP transporter solute-binding subunit [Paracoccus sp. (in: a-proteobacteria)]|nr:TAXI family TRAP transporter solute-binding subunit [Paracoccus sp. (in: a-proteobacteria)]